MIVWRPAARPAPGTRSVLILLACVLLPALLVPDLATAQGAAGPAHSDSTPDEQASRTRFASFDVGFGVVLPEEGQVGISYGVGVDVANLLISGTAIRFGFRFWTSEDHIPDGRTVDLDDAVLSIMVKKNIRLGRVDAYAGLGAGGHFIAARFDDLGAETEERNGFRPGLEGILGLEYPLADRGFVSLFGEGQGSLVSDLSQLSLQAGVRIRFDRLGTGG